MAPLVVPVQGVARFGIHSDNKHTTNNGYLTSQTSELHGAGHLGVSPLDRIIMSLNSGLESEIEYALSTLTYYSCNEPAFLNFATYPVMGHELMRFFIKPFHLIADGRESAVDEKVMLLSAESLLSLRNAAQDLHNQQWLSQMPGLRRHLAEALKFLVTWFSVSALQQSKRLQRFGSIFTEMLVHVLDVLDPLTCFYVDNHKNEPLFHHLLTLLSYTRDKYILVTTIKCLCHLLFLGGPDATTPREVDDQPQEANNCIDALEPEHLQIIARNLFIHDDELTYACLQFVKQYLSSKALHPLYAQSVSESQLHRLRKLVQAHSSKENLHTLMKLLPEYIVANLPLVDSASLKPEFPLQLARRSRIAQTPAQAPKLPQNLYEIIIAFPEPLRATTWLRCCYEPFSKPAKTSKDPKETTAGEVTQISLWKAYENQFESIWKDRANQGWPNLLPAVDFIKNVSAAFPNSEAMVVNLPSTDPSQPPRKKFIIKGILPRVASVDIERGNFEALRRLPPAADVPETIAKSVGEIDEAVFQQAVRHFTDSLIEASEALTEPLDLSVPWFSPINVLARDILTIVMDGLVVPDDIGLYKTVFRQYNKGWLPGLVFANPGLVEQGYIEGKWLQYLL